jgi:hypothetical protein
VISLGMYRNILSSSRFLMHEDLRFWLLSWLVVWLGQTTSSLKVLVDYKASISEMILFVNLEIRTYFIWR